MLMEHKVCLLEMFLKNERKEIKTFSKKCNSVINIGKLLRIES